MVLSLGALGVVFGDIGTSPLYTLKECMMAAGGAKASVDDLFGILSLMFWSLIMVVTVKYLTFVMRADHHGEGGIFALLAIVPERFRATAAKSGKVTGMALLAVIGASLLYGDGVITPAISVLSAVEGLAIASPRLSPVVVPLTCVILVGLFSIQRRGTGDVGKLFGPVMAVWFAVLAAASAFAIFSWSPGLPCWRCSACFTLPGTRRYWRRFRRYMEQRSSGGMGFVVPSFLDRSFWW